MPEKTATQKKLKKRNFSSFTYTEAYKQLGIKTVGIWTIDTPPKAPSEFLNQRSGKFNLNSDPGVVLRMPFQINVEQTELNQSLI